MTGDGRRRARGPLSALRFLRGQVGIRGRALRQELLGTLRDLRAFRGWSPDASLALLAHQDRLRPGPIIEAGLEDLRDRLMADPSAVVITSRVGFRLRPRGVRAVLSLEPVAAAPAVRFPEGVTSAVLVADVWDKTWLARHLDRCRATYLLTPYLRGVADVPALGRIDPARWRLFPWWVPDAVVASRSARDTLAPEVAVVGAMGPMYDLRTWVAAHPLVTRVAHASAYEPGAARLDRRAYFALLGACSAIVVAFSEDERMRVPVAKYVEVPGVGALLIGARARHLEEMGFRDGDNCLLFEGREDFAARVGAFIDRPEAFVAVAARGLELVRARHTTSARLAELRAMLGA